MSLTVGLETAALMLGKGRSGREEGNVGVRLPWAERGVDGEVGEVGEVVVAPLGLRGEGRWEIARGESAEAIWTISSGLDCEGRLCGSWEIACVLAKPCAGRVAGRELHSLCVFGGCSALEYNSDSNDGDDEERMREGVGGTGLIMAGLGWGLGLYTWLWWRL